MQLGQRSFTVAVAACAACAAFGLAPPARAAGPADPAPAASTPSAAPPANPASAVDVPLPPLDEARPPLPPEPEHVALTWQHHIEVGGGVAFVEMPTSEDGAHEPTAVRFRPGVGFHVDLSWQVLRYLRFTGYLIECANALELPPGSLGVAGTISAPLVHSYTFGARVSPTLPLGARVRLWVTAGVGWGHLAYDRFTVDADGSTIPSRSSTIFTIPVGVGAAVEIIPRRLSVHAELTGSFVPSQIGDALDEGQYIDKSGLMRNVNPMPQLDAIFTQTLGLSLHL